MVICRDMVRYGAEDVMIRKDKWARDGAEYNMIWDETRLEMGEQT